MEAGSLSVVGLSLKREGDELRTHRFVLALYSNRTRTATRVAMIKITRTTRDGNRTEVTIGGSTIAGISPRRQLAEIVCSG